MKKGKIKIGERFFEIRFGIEGIILLQALHTAGIITPQTMNQFVEKILNQKKLPFLPADGVIIAGGGVAKFVELLGASRKDFENFDLVFSSGPHLN